MYGYMGAAATIVASSTFSTLLTIVFSKRYFVLEITFKSLRKAACTSAIMGAAVYPVRNRLASSSLINLLAGIPLGIAVYSVILFLRGWNPTKR
jgi:hypothetical protein